MLLDMFKQVWRSVYKKKYLGDWTDILCPLTYSKKKIFIKILFLPIRLTFYRWILSFSYIRLLFFLHDFIKSYNSQQQLEINVV